MDWFKNKIVRSTIGLPESHQYLHKKVRPKDTNQEADNLSSENVAKGKEIHRVAAKLVKEIEGVFKAARDEQDVVPWPGTEELLSILSGVPFRTSPNTDLDGSASKEDESIGKFDESEVRLKLGHLVNDALGLEDVKGDFCALLLDQSMFQHPEFVKKCTEAGLPNVLVLCLRIIRVIDYENIIRIRNATEESEVKEAKAIADKVLICTDRVTMLLSSICSRGDAVVGDQIKPHLSSLLNLAASAYPEESLHIQYSSMRIVKSLMSSAAMTSSAASLLYHSKVILDIVKELSHLSKYSTQPQQQIAAARAPYIRQRTNSLRSPTRRSSPRSRTKTYGQNQHISELNQTKNDDDEKIELTGLEAEKKGSWLTATTATVSTITRSFSLFSTILSDFESSGGYSVLAYMVIHSSEKNLKEMLMQISLLVTSNSSGQISSLQEAQQAMNPRAFCIFRAALVNTTPVLNEFHHDIKIVHKSEWYDIQLENADSGVAFLSADDAEMEFLVTSTICRRCIDHRLSRLHSEMDESTKGEMTNKDLFRMELLDSALHLYTNHPSNYLLLEPSYHLLTLYLSSILYFESEDLKQLILKTLEVVCVMLKDVQPNSSLSSASTVLHICIAKSIRIIGSHSEMSKQEESVHGGETVELLQSASFLVGYAEDIWCVFEKLLQFDRIKYSSLFRHIGLLVRVIEPLLRDILSVTPENLNSSDFSSSQLITDIVSLLCRMLSWLVNNDMETSLLFRQLNMHHHLYDIITHRSLEATNAALTVLEKIAESSPHESIADMSFLLEVIQGESARKERWRQAATIVGLKGIICNGGDVLRNSFRTSCGFEAVLATISGLDGVFGDDSDDGEVDHSKEECYDVMWAAMATLSAAVMSSTGSLYGHLQNRSYLGKEIGYWSLSCCLVNSGVMKSKRYAPGVVNFVFQLITERQAEFIKPGSRLGVRRKSSLSPADSKIRNADAVLLLLALLPVFSEVLSLLALDCLIQVITSGGYDGLQALCDSHLLSKVACKLIDAENHEAEGSNIVTTTLTKSGSSGKDLNAPLKADFSRDWSINLEKSGLSWNGDGAITFSIKSKLLEVLKYIASYHFGFSDFIPVMKSTLMPLLRSEWSVDDEWKRLEVLGTVARVGNQNPSFFRLGGADTLRLSPFVHAVTSVSIKLQQQASQRRMSQEEMLKTPAASSQLHRALARVAHASGTQFLYIPGLGDGNCSAWPGTHGYSFACWIRFAPPHPDDVINVSNAHNVFHKMESWSKLSTEHRSIRGPKVSMIPPSGNAATTYYDSKQHSSKHQRLRMSPSMSIASSDDSSHFQSSSGNGETDGSSGEVYMFPFTGFTTCRRIIWLASFASSDGRVFLTAYVDVQSLAVCVRISTAPTIEYRFGPILEFATASQHSWHHIMITHSRPKSRLIASARDRVHIYVNGAQIGRIKFDPVPFESIASGSYQNQQGSVNLYIGVPHPYMFLDRTIEQTAMPQFHLHACILVGDALDEKAAATMFEVGPSYEGSYTGEQPQISSYLSIATMTLQRVQALGGEYGFSTLSSVGGVTEAFMKRGLSSLIPHLNVTERSQQKKRLERAKVTERFFAFFNADHIAFALNPHNVVSTKNVDLTEGSNGALDMVCMIEKSKVRSMYEEYIDVWVISSIGARAVLGCIYGQGPAQVATNSFPDVVNGIGGPRVFYSLILDSPTDIALARTLRLLDDVTRSNAACMKYMQHDGGLILIAHLLREYRRTRDMPLSAIVARSAFALAVSEASEPVQAFDNISSSSEWERSLIFPKESERRDIFKDGDCFSDFLLLTNAQAFKQLVINHQVWGLCKSSHPALVEVIRLISRLVSPLNNASYGRFNARLLTELGLLKWTLHLMLEVSGANSRSFDSSQQQEQNEFPSAAVAAAGLDHRHQLLGACGLMLQRIMMLCVASKSFRSVCGACNSTLSDFSMDFRVPGSVADERIASSERALEKSCIAPEADSHGTIVLTGQAMVRVYLLRCLLDVFHTGRHGWNEGSFSVNTGGASCVQNNGISSDCVENIPAYFDLLKLMQTCVDAFVGALFTSTLESAGEEASVSLAMRLLVFLLQNSSDYAAAFTKRFEGLSVLKSTLIYYSASLPVMLLALVLAVGVPVYSLPPHLEDLSIESVASIFSNSWSLEVPAMSSEAAKSHVHLAILERYATVCTVDVLIPCVSRNMAVIYGGGVKNTDGDATRAVSVNIIVLSSLLCAYGKPRGFHPKRSNKFRKIFRDPEAVDALTRCLGEALHWEAFARGEDPEAERYLKCKEMRGLLCELIAEVAVDAALCGDPAYDITNGAVIPQSGQSISESFRLLYKIFCSMTENTLALCGSSECSDLPSFGFIVGALLNRLKERCAAACQCGDARSLAGFGGMSSAITEAVVDDILMGPELAVSAVDVLLDLLRSIELDEARQPMIEWLGLDAHCTIRCEVACSCAVAITIALRRSAALVAAEILTGPDEYPAPKVDIQFLLQMLNETPLLSVLMDDVLFKEMKDVSGNMHTPNGKSSLSGSRFYQVNGPRKQSLAMMLDRINREIEYRREKFSISPVSSEMLAIKSSTMRKESVLMPSMIDPISSEDSRLALALGAGRRKSSNYGFDIQGIDGPHMIQYGELCRNDKRNRSSRFATVPQEESDFHEILYQTMAAQQPWLINKTSWVDKLIGITDIVLTTGMMADLPTMLMCSDEAIRAAASVLLSRVLHQRPSLVCDLVSKRIFIQLESLLEKKDPDSSSDLFAWLQSASNDEKLRLEFRSIAEKSAILLPTNGFCSFDSPSGSSMESASRKRSGSVAFWADSKHDTATAARIASHGSLKMPKVQSWKTWSTQSGYQSLPGAAERYNMVSETFRRVSESHRRWVWNGIEDLSFAIAIWSKHELRELSLLSSNPEYSTFGFSEIQHSPNLLTAATHWELDLSEGPCRMRIKMIPNHDFYDEYNVIVRSQQGPADRVGEGESISSTVPKPLERRLSFNVDSVGMADLTELLKDMTKLAFETKMMSKRNIGSGLSPRNDEDMETPLQYKSMFEEDYEEDNLEASDGTIDILQNNDAVGDQTRLHSKQSFRRTDTLDSEEMLQSNSQLRTADPEDEMELCTQNGSASPKAKLSTIPDDAPRRDTCSTEQVSENFDDSAADHLFLESNNSAQERPVLSGYNKMLLDYDVALGCIDSDDWPIEAIYDVTRCVGLETRGAVLVLTKNTFIVIEGYEVAAKRGSWSSLKNVHASHSGRADGAHLLQELRRIPNATSSSKLKVRIHRSGSSCLSEQALSNMVESENTDAELAQLQKCRDVSVLSRYNTNCSEDTEARAYEDAMLTPLLDGIDVFKISVNEVHGIYKRRFELRDVALELFDVHGRSVLIAFKHHRIQEEALEIMLSRDLPRSIFATSRHRMKLPVTGGIDGSNSTYKRFMQARRMYSTRKWQEGQMCNFDYLMELNTLAGRTFNDITQYPVFPWVLSDYTSQTLDLTNPKVYRDLSKPMGALGKERAEQFKERYASLVESKADGDFDEPPPFHYGTHYSCPGYVLYYLLRLEPYTRMALTLQGGQFDKADRLFRDVRSSWESASSENLQDVRELIPEFYCLPEFLQNMNGFDFGITQRGSVVNHVHLPPWANNDPREFIRLHRCALESPIVSAGLHQWVDLIFGYKQTGAEAVKAQNTFVHLTYEGVVDIDAIKDPLMREATLSQIRNFGLTPTKLFKRPHEQRNIPSVIKVDERGQCSVDNAAYAWHVALTPPLCIVGCPNIAAMKSVPLSGGSLNNAGAWSGGSIGDLQLVKDKVVLTGSSCILFPGSSGDEYMRFGGISRGVAFYQFGMGSQSGFNGQPDFMLSCHDDLHTAPITVAVFAKSGTILCTGSQDGTLRVWKINPGYYVGSGKSLVLLETLYVHTGPISSVDVSEKFQIIVAGTSVDARVLVWDLNTLSFLRELHGHQSKVDAVSINDVSGGVVTLSNAELRLWGMNGDMVAQCSAAALRRFVYIERMAVKTVSLPTVAVSTHCGNWQDGIVAVTGHSNGDVSLWGVRWGSAARRGGFRQNPSSEPVPEDLVCRRVLNGVHNRAISCVRVSDDQRELLVGDSKGVVSRWQCLKLGDLSQTELSDLTSL